MKTLVGHTGFGSRCLVTLLCWLVVPFAQAQHHIGKYLQLGDSLYYSNPDSSYRLCLCAQKEAAQYKDAAKTAEARLCKVRYLILKARYEEASSELGKAITYFEKTGDKNNLAKAYNSKAILLERLGDDDGKYNYQNEAVRLYEETGNTEGQVKMLSNLSLSYTYDKRFREAQECLDRILMMMDKLRQTDIYFYYQNYGILYMHKGDFKKAAFNLETAISIAREQKMIDSEITALTRLAEANIQLKQFAAAQQLLTRAQVLANENALEFELDEVYTAFITLFTTQGKYQQAFETLTLQNALKAKTDRLQSIHHINEQDKKSDLHQRLNIHVGKLKKESARLGLQLQELNRWLWILVAVAALLLTALAWAIYNLVKVKRKLSDQRQVLERLYRQKQAEHLMENQD